MCGTDTVSLLVEAEAMNESVACLLLIIGCGDNVYIVIAPNYVQRVKHCRLC